MHLNTSNQFVFNGIDYEEIGIAITGNKCPDDLDGSDWVAQFIREENIDTLRQFLIAFIDHASHCASGGRSDQLPIFKALLEITDTFPFLQAYSCLYPLMWC